MARIRLRYSGNHRYGYEVKRYRDKDGKKREKWVYLGRYDPETATFTKVRESGAKPIDVRRRPDPLKPGTYFTGLHAKSRMYEVECAQCGYYNSTAQCCDLTGEHVENLSAWCERFILPEDLEKERAST